MNMRSIPWETSLSGKPAFIDDEMTYDKSFMLTRNLIYREIVKKTFLTPYVLSGQFNNNTYVFQPETTILFDNKNSIQYYGIFTRSFGIDKRYKQPVSCIRNGYWDDSVIQSLNNFCKDSSSSIIENLNIKVTNLFYNANDSIKIFELIKNIGHTLSGGIGFNEGNVSLLKVDQIEIETWDKEIKYHFILLPKSRTCNQLETEIINILTEIEKITSKRSMIPDNELRISYNESIFERESEFSHLRKNFDYS